MYLPSLKRQQDGAISPILDWCYYMRATPTTSLAVKYLHRCIFYPLLVVAFGWGVLALRINPLILIYDLQFFELLKATYIICFTAVFWPIAYIELVDYLHSRLGRNGRQYLDYAKSLQKDLVVAGFTAFVLASIYWIDSVNYGFSGIDIGFVGFPFLVNALYTLIQSTRVSIGGQRVRKRVPLLLFGVVLAFTIAAFWLLVKNASGELDTDQALFLQLTILFCGIYFFLSSNYILHTWKQGHFESSAFKRYFFSEVVRSKQQLYSRLGEGLGPLNRQLAQRKSQYAAAVRKRQKGSSRHRR